MLTHPAHSLAPPPSRQILSLVVLALAGAAVLPLDGQAVQVLTGTSFAIVAGLVANLPYVAQSVLDAGMLRTLVNPTKQLLQGWVGARLHAFLLLLTPCCMKKTFGAE